MELEWFDDNCNYSLACGIPDQETDSIIVTGGVRTQTRVSQYDRNGFVKNLASLNTGRDSHGCAQFTDNGVKVSLNNSTAFHITNTIRSCWLQVVKMVLKGLSPPLRSCVWTAPPQSGLQLEIYLCQFMG